MGVVAFFIFDGVFDSLLSNNPNNNYVYQPAVIPDGYVLYSSDKIEIAVPSWWQDVNTAEYRQLLLWGVEQLDGQISPELSDFIEQNRSRIESASYEIMAMDFNSGTNMNIRFTPTGYIELTELMTRFPSEMREYGLRVLESKIIQLPVGEAVYFRASWQSPGDSMSHMYLIQMNNRLY